MKTNSIEDKISLFNSFASFVNLKTTKSHKYIV